MVLSSGISSIFSSGFTATSPPQFVSSVCLVPGCPDLLLSSSGDGTVKCWDFKSGEELSSRLCYEDAGMAALDGVEEKGDGGDGGNGGDITLNVAGSDAYVLVAVDELDEPDLPPTR